MYHKNTYFSSVFTKDVLDTLRPLLEDGYGVREAKINEELDNYKLIQEIKIYNPNNKKEKLTIIGNDQTLDVKRLTISDVYASISYYLNLLHIIRRCW